MVHWTPAVLRSSGVSMQYVCMGWRQPSTRSCVFLAKDPSSCPADGVFVGRILGGSAWLEFGFQFASAAPSWKPVRSQKRWEMERLGWEWRWQQPGPAFSHKSLSGDAEVLCSVTFSTLNPGLAVPLLTSLLLSWTSAAAPEFPGETQLRAPRYTGEPGELASPHFPSPSSQNFEIKF